MQQPLSTDTVILTATKRQFGDLRTSSWETLSRWIFSPICYHYSCMIFLTWLHRYNQQPLSLNIILLCSCEFSFFPFNNLQIQVGCIISSRMDYFLRHHGSTASTSTRQREIIANISLVFSSSHSLCCMKM